MARTALPLLVIASLFTACLAPIDLCVPRTCAELGRECGSTGDGCGGQLSCPSCSAPKVCTATGTCCLSSTCEGLGRNCGQADDGCGGTLECGTCAGLCGTDGRCCLPETDRELCESAGRYCDALQTTDRCGTARTAQCGTCSLPQTCGGGGRTSACGVAVPAWRQRTPSSSPPARSTAFVAYDSHRGVTVLFGGTSSQGTLLADTWEWDGTDWTKKEPVHSPPAQEGQTLAYDPARRRCVLLGAHGTWLWDGSDWSNPQTATPDPPYGQAVWAPSLGKVVAQAGPAPSAGVSDAEVRLWTWDGQQWEERVPVGDKPAERLGAALAFEPTGSQGRLLLCGGLSPFGRTLPFGDTWAFENAWADLGTSPPARGWARLVWHAQRQALVLVGGVSPHFDGRITYQNQVDDLWARTTAWSELTPTSALSPARDRHALVYDARRNVVLVFGGRTCGGGTQCRALGDTWELDW